MNRLALQNAENHGKSCNPGATEIPGTSLSDVDARTHRERKRRCQSFSGNHLPLQCRRPPGSAPVERWPVYQFTSDEIDVGELKARLRKMTDQDLRFGRAAAYMCSPQANYHEPREAFVLQLVEARDEWPRRKAREEVYNWQSCPV
jgi:hypothetical protein